MDLKEIQRLVREGKYEFSIHAQQERLGEDLDGSTREREEARHERLRGLRLLWRRGSRETD